METTKLTVPLAKGETGTIHPEVEGISGLISTEEDTLENYHEHTLRKY